MSTINSKLGFKFSHKPSFQPSHKLNNKPNHKFNLTIATLLALVLSTFMGTFGGVSALASTGSFKDVGSNTTYQEEITDLAKEGVIHGYGDGNYGPNNYLTRGELAKIIKNTLWGKAYSNLKCTDFPDVDTNNTFYLEITTLKCEGVVNGYPDGTFKPNAKVSIAEAIKFTFNNNKYTPASKPLQNYNRSKLFKKNLARDTFGAFIDKAVQNGALDQDYDGGLLDVSWYINRKQMANLIHRARKPNQEKIKKKFVSINPEDQKILLELERELGVQIPRVEVIETQEIEMGFIYFGYALNSEDRVTHLNLEKSEVQTKHLPLIGKLASLEWLGLSGNKITKIEGLDNLTGLKQLYLGSNQITKIQQLDKLTSLQELNLWNNQISKIEGLDNLISLEWLGLNGNKITKIEELDSLTGLNGLDLSGNKITKIEGLDNLISLEWLDLSGNKITKIEGLTNSINLEQLWLWDNQITDAIPLEALLLNQKKAGKPILNILLFHEDYSNSLGGNPLQTPPMEVMDKGSEAFLKWVEENR